MPTAPRSLLCTNLSAVLLIELVLNATLDWGWTDPIAGLVTAAVTVRERVDAWTGEGAAHRRGFGGATGGGCSEGACTYGS